MRRFSFLAGAAIAALALATPAGAVTVVVTDGSTSVFNASKVAGAGEKVVTFDLAAPLPAGVTVTGGSLLTGTSGSGAQPFGSDGSQYLSVLGGQQAEIRDTIAAGYNIISFYLGSIDTYNTVSVLDTAGAVIASFTGSAFLGGPSGNQSLPQTNRLITLSRDSGEAAFGGLRVQSSQNSAEVENVRFASAVPEPATWMLMLAGFGVVGFSMRRRRNVRVSFA